MGSGGTPMSNSIVRHAQLTDVPLPDFGMPTTEPALPPELYGQRLERLRERMESRRYDHILVWGDREHSANVAYLTGFDPRFEETLLVISATGGQPALLLGNECYGGGEVAPLSTRRVKFQGFILPGQSRDESAALTDILSGEGIRRGSRVGVVGWKTYSNRETMEVPAFVVDELRRLCGSGGLVENANDLLIEATDGLRVINEVEQLARFEWAACQTSSGVRQVLTGLRPGMTEREAVRLLEWNGTPLSCHLMLSAGPRARHGLMSPGDRPFERGDPFTIAFGIWGALNCRAGFLVEDAGELADIAHDYVDRLVAPYFTAVAEWYGALHVGQTGGALQEIVNRHLGDDFFGVSLNP